MGDRQINLQFGHGTGASVDAYLEYRRCVSLNICSNDEANSVSNIRFIGNCEV